MVGVFTKTLGTMSRIRWEPLNKAFNTTISNKTVPRTLISNEDTMHPDVLITFLLIAALAVHSAATQSKKSVKSGIFSLACLIVSAILAPFVGATLLVFYCYRYVSKIIISRSCKPCNFAGLLDGTDAFWAIEDESSYSVINVLVTADFSSTINNNEEPLQTVRELITDRILSKPDSFMKLLCFRQQSWLGYFYWEKQNHLDIHKHIQSMDIPTEDTVAFTENILNNYISSVVNLPLPESNKSTWEILVGQQPVVPKSEDNLSKMESNSHSSLYPILFRIHHTVGDGVALVNLLMSSLSDACARPPSPRHLAVPETQRYFQETVPSFCVDIPQDVCSVKKSSTYNFQDYYTQSFQDSYPEKIKKITKTARAACRKFLEYIKESNLKNSTNAHRCLQDINILVNDRPSIEFLELIQNSQLTPHNNSQFCTNANLNIMKLFRQNYQINYLINLLNTFKMLPSKLSTLCFAPACFFNQALSRKNDVNILHGPRLSGEKVVAWYWEQETKKNSLMNQIQRIRAKTGAHFSDIILTALSSSLETFFKQYNEVPCDITTIIPACVVLPNTNSSRNLIKSKDNITNTTKSDLYNKFSVALLTLPIASSCKGKVALFSKLRQVRKHTELLRHSPDYLINYWFLKIVATLFPVSLLRPMFKSTQSSVVVSNLPGPRESVTLAGNFLHDLVFWVPNKETTGVGVTILTYAGRLQLGIIADRALISSQEDVQLILRNLVSAIKEMDKISSSE